MEGYYSGEQLCLVARACPLSSWQPLVFGFGPVPSAETDRRNDPASLQKKKVGEVSISNWALTMTLAGRVGSAIS